MNDLNDRVNVLTLKRGTLYSAEHVNRIYRGVKAQLKRPVRRGRHLNTWPLPCPWVKELREK